MSKFKLKNLLTSNFQCVKKFTLFPYKNPYQLKFILKFEKLTTFTSSFQPAGKQGRGKAGKEN